MAFASITGFAQSKFAHVNFSELVQLMPEADEARAVMTASSNEAQETFQTMVDEFQSKYNTYQQKASTWTQTIRESKEKELSDLDQRIQEFQQSIQTELQAQQNQLMAPIYEKATKVVEKLAKAGGYIYVFEQFFISMPLRVLTLHRQPERNSAFLKTVHLNHYRLSFRPSSNSNKLTTTGGGGILRLFLPIEANPTT